MSLLHLPSADRTGNSEDERVDGKMDNGGVFLGYQEFDINKIVQQKVVINRKTSTRDGWGQSALGELHFITFSVM